MTNLIGLRRHDCKAQNMGDILGNIKMNAGSIACELDINKFAETLVVYPIFCEF